MNYIIYLTSKKEYGVKKEGGKRALKVFKNKKEAWDYAQSLADKNNGKVIDQTILSSNKKKTKKSKKKIKKMVLSFVVCFILIPIFYLVADHYGWLKKEEFIPIKPTAGVVYDDFQIHMMQLGNNKNGDAIYIKAGENDILIDAGVLDTTTIKNYMKGYITDNKLEYLIVTHGDSDHIEGMVGSGKNPGILDSYEIDTLIDFSYTTKNLKTEKGNLTTYGEYVEKRDALVSNNKLKHFTAKDFFDNYQKSKGPISLGTDIEMEILWNKFYFEQSSDENNHSVVTRFRVKDRYYLLTGDLEKEGETAFVEHYKNDNMRVDFYKAAHHGSKTSSNENFLNLIQPSICAVSCSAGNSEYTANYLNVFPTQDFVTRIKKYTTQVYVTSNGMGDKEEAMNGNIIISSNGENTGVASTNDQNELKELKDTEWFNMKIYVKEDNSFVSGKAKKDYFTKDTEGVKEVPFRTW